MYKIGKSLIVAAAFATGSICAFEVPTLDELAASGAITNTPGILETAAQGAAAQFANSDIVINGTAAVTDVTAKAADAATELATQLKNSQAAAKVEEISGKVTEIANKVLESVGAAQLAQTPLTPSVDVSVALPDKTVETILETTTPTVVENAATASSQSIIAITPEPIVVLAPVLPIEEKSFAAKMATSAHDMGTSFLNYGLSDETVAAKNGTYYAANTAKIVALALVTYGVYRATKYAYATYGKKIVKA